MRGMIVLVVFVWLCNVQFFFNKAHTTAIVQSTLEDLSTAASASGEDESSSNPATAHLQTNHFTVHNITSNVISNNPSDTAAAAPTDTKLKRWHTIYGAGWDKDPIIIEEYRLVFFTIPKVGCTVFKQLFRRMMGYSDWHVQREPYVPHDPGSNGLKYLHHYPVQKANHFLTSPEWTRAIFIRDPKERILSAYLDKVIKDTALKGGYIQRNCCTKKHKPNICGVSAKKRVPSVTGDDCSFQCFLNDITKHCDDPHWRPQKRRIDKIFWENIDFVGHMETMSLDAETLLKKLRSTKTNSVDAWERYGNNGWGKDRNE